MPTANSSASTKKAKGMNKKMLTHFEKRLQEERKRVLKELGRADEVFGGQQADDGDLSSYSFHMADQGTDAMEREKSFLFASKEGRYLYRIEEALRRLYKDPEGFGICHGCKNDIPFQRLEALPHARYCLDCKLREEEEKAA
jgi:RNA polymerase-binding transcription factor DksA